MHVHSATTDYIEVLIIDHVPNAHFIINATYSALIILTSKIYESS